MSPTGGDMRWGVVFLVLIGKAAGTVLDTLYSDVSYQVGT